MPLQVFKISKKNIKVKILILRAKAIYRSRQGVYRLLGSRETADSRDASLDKTQITKGVRYPCGHCFFSAPTSGKLFVSFFKIQGVKIKYRVFWKIFQYSRPVNVSKGALLRDHSLGVTECVRAKLQPRTDKQITDRSVADFKKIIQH